MTGRFPDSMVLTAGLATRTGVHSVRHSPQTNVILQTSSSTVHEESNGQDVALNWQL